MSFANVNVSASDVQIDAVIKKDVFDDERVISPTDAIPPAVPPDSNSLLISSIGPNPGIAQVSSFRSLMSFDETIPGPLAADAFYGLPGEIVGTIEPHTEAAPAALLIQLLVTFGNLAGRSAHFVAEGDRHYPNLFAVLVGATSKGRKGSSWGHIKSLMEQVEPLTGRIQSGLSSGEGLIFAVRDNNHHNGDLGQDDKRLLVMEPEFASVLKNSSREGNILSATVRQAWDSGDLRILTKNSPLHATAAHISIIGHITKEELRRYMNATETANGFANRFVWVFVQRSKLLPEGGSPDPQTIRELAGRLKDALSFAKTVVEVKRDDAAREVWIAVYPQLSEGKLGMFGATTSRGEAQVMRLALVYALMDQSSVIRREHLAAALAVWKLNEDSARWVFGNAIGDPVADEILAALRNTSSGMTRTEIRDLFKRNKTAEQIERSLQLLLEMNLAKRYDENTGGRPTERWFAFTLPFPTTLSKN